MSKTCPNCNRNISVNDIFLFYPAVPKPQFRCKNCNELISVSGWKDGPAFAFRFGLIGFIGVVLIAFSWIFPDLTDRIPRWITTIFMLILLFSVDHFSKPFFLKKMTFVVKKDF